MYSCRMYFYILNLVLLSHFWILDVQSHKPNEPLVVSTPWGEIKGSILTSRRGKPIYSFRGIRYAEPPINELRFKPAVPIEKVEGVYDATKDGFSCPQPGYDPTSEDCLFLNVYTTKLPRDKQNPKRPVIVYIHPGGFFFSSSVSEWAGPQYFMDQEIVLVSFNWRIATLGFLSTGDKEAPGNNGLKDQVVVLKWIQKNIESFGGDPNSVTLLGYSAGAWSVILHMVSPMSEGLFHKGLALSGSPLDIWPLPHNQTNIAEKQAKILGCQSVDTTQNIIKCLKKKSASDLGNSLLQFREFGEGLGLVWSPVIEPDVGQERFLPDHPIRLIVKGQFKQVPFICGRTKDEFGYGALGVIGNKTLTKQMNDDFLKIAPIAFSYERNTEFSKSVSRAIKSFYFHNEPIGRSQETALKQLYEDTLGFAMHRTANLISQYSRSPVYYYRFSYQGRWSHYYLPGTNNTVPYGVVHHDDLIYLLYIAKSFPLFKEHTPKEVEMVEKLTTLYANFAKTGNPTPFKTNALDNIKWEPHTPENQKYLEIGKQLKMMEKLNEKRFQFWEKLYPISLYLEEGSEH